MAEHTLSLFADYDPPEAPLAAPVVAEPAAQESFPPSEETLPADVVLTDPRRAWEDQLRLDVGLTWQEQEWQGMPEFVQQDLTPFKTLAVHFESAEDLQAFAVLVGQRINRHTAFIWFPQAAGNVSADKRWVAAPPPESLYARLQREAAEE